MDVGVRRGPAAGYPLNPTRCSRIMHFLWLNWGPCPPCQDMAYSIEADIYLASIGL